MFTNTQQCLEALIAWNAHQRAEPDNPNIMWVRFYLRRKIKELQAAQ